MIGKGRPGISCVVKEQECSLAMADLGRFSDVFAGGMKVQQRQSESHERPRQIHKIKSGSEPHCIPIPFSYVH